jgi:hypothetical protein
MDTTFIAIVLQISGWGLFFRGVYQLRRESWARARLLLFWCSTALLGCSTFCFAAAPLLGWGQIGWLMITGALCSVAGSAMWGMFSSEPRVGPLKAQDVERADTPPVGKWNVPSFADMMGSGNPWADSPTIAGIEAMGGN